MKARLVKYDGTVEYVECEDPYRGYVMDDYKWLAMDEDEHAETWVEKPSFDGEIWCNEGNYLPMDCGTPPTFLKPGQLWERVITGFDFVRFETDGYKKWNGYWWRLAEDNSISPKIKSPNLDDRAALYFYPKYREQAKQPVDAGLYDAAKGLESGLYGCTFSKPIKPLIDNFKDALANSAPVEPQGWITDRRPTEKDAWKYEGDCLNWMLLTWNGTRDAGVPEVINLIDWNGQPFMVAPASLRTKPEEPKCDKCASQVDFNRTDGVNDLRTFCTTLNTFTYGPASDCKGYTPKEKGDE